MVPGFSGANLANLSRICSTVEENKLTEMDMIDLQWVFRKKKMHKNKISVERLLKRTARSVEWSAACLLLHMCTYFHMKHFILFQMSHSFTPVFYLLDWYFKQHVASISANSVQVEAVLTLNGVLSAWEIKGLILARRGGTSAAAFLCAGNSMTFLFWHLLTMLLLDPCVMGARKANDLIMPKCCTSFWPD